jgi:hypothetical protein
VAPITTNNNSAKVAIQAAVLCNSSRICHFQFFDNRRPFQKSIVSDFAKHSVKPWLMLSTDSGGGTSALFKTPHKFEWML